tara:strand:- start:775 stop:891 length:117 start_codon:yes stop_codon:yes gene_type:complete
MKNIKLLTEKFNSLNKRGKMITIFAGLVITIVILDWLF